MVHQSVLANKVIEYLDPHPGENFIDCNFGLGGHSIAILRHTKPSGRILGIDLDQASIGQFKKTTPDEILKRVTLVRGNFADLKLIKEENNFYPVHGIIFDLGMSRWQLEASGRGFSFLKDEPLKMNYQDQELTAAKIVNQWPEDKLVKILKEYGQEKFAHKIAQKIIIFRKQKPITSTKQLKEIIKHATPRYYHQRKINWATKTFQALRIAVNDELNNLEKALPQALEILEPHRRLAVISFHSLEDKIVKNFLKKQARDNKLKIITKKPETSDKASVKQNPSSRSAKLRVAQKL